MSAIFSHCSSLKEINLFTFNTNNLTDMGYMFSGCTDEIKNKIKSQIKIINPEDINKNRNIYNKNSSGLSGKAIAGTIIVFVIAIIVAFILATFK